MTVRWLLALGCVVLAVVACAGSAHAQDADSYARSASEGADTASTAPARSSETRRDASYYRGRAPQVRSEDVVLWIPRAVFLPLYLLGEYLIRAPILALLEWAERNHVIAFVNRVLNPTPDFSWSPTLSFEAGVFALPGLRADWRNAGVAGHTLSVAGTFANDGFWSAQGRDTWDFSPVSFGVRGGYVTRPERAYYGLGPTSPNVRTNFRETRGEAAAFLALADASHVRAELSGGWSYEAIGPGMAPAAQLADDGLGIGPYHLALFGLDLRLDSRRVPEENGGVRFHGTGQYGYDTAHPTPGFVRADAELEGAVEVARPDRVVAGRVWVAETASLDGAPVPLLHLPTLGWANHQGFVLGRFRGEAALLAELRYRYPVAYFVDVQWTASVGNVFARDFSDFTPGALTGSFGVGLRTRRTGSDPLELTLAFGTNRFDAGGFGIESVRLYLSTTQGL